VALDLSPGRGSNSALGGAILIVVAVLLVGGLMAIRLTVTGGACSGTPSALLAVVLDATSRVADAQRLDLENRLRTRVRSLPAGALVEFWRVSPTGGGVPQPLGDPLCRPDPSPNVWTQNQRRAQEAIQAFDAEIQAKIDATLTGRDEPESPILESIQAVWLRFLGNDRWPGSVPRQLVVVSDLVQNTPALSFYGRVPRPDQLKALPSYQQLRVPLRGADVELLYLKHDDGVEAGALVELWEWIVSDLGGNLTRVSRITG
jgi:hypothetical protein